MALAALAFLIWRRMPSPSRPPESPPVADPLARLTPRQAYESGVQLVNQEKFTQSLPYLRYALLGTKGRIWQVPFAVFCALRNETFAIGRRVKVPGPSTRSSFERVGMVREALHHLDLAEAATERPRDIATIRWNRAQLLEAWGLGWDAFVAYRLAQQADSTWAAAAQYADHFMELMQDPTTGARSTVIRVMRAPR